MPWSANCSRVLLCWSLNCRTVSRGREGKRRVETERETERAWSKTRGWTINLHLDREHIIPCRHAEIAECLSSVLPEEQNCTHTQTSNGLNEQLLRLWPSFSLALTPTRTTHCRESCLKARSYVYHRPTSCFTKYLWVCCFLCFGWCVSYQDSRLSVCQLWVTTWEVIKRLSIDKY